MIVIVISPKRLISQHYSTNIPYHILFDLIHFCSLSLSVGQEDLDASNPLHVKSCPYLPGTANRYSVSSRSSKLSLNQYDKEDGTGSDDNNANFNDDATTANINQIRETRGIDYAFRSCPPAAKDINTSRTYQSPTHPAPPPYLEEHHHIPTLALATRSSCQSLQSYNYSVCPIKCQEYPTVSCKYSPLSCQSTRLKKQTSKCSLNRERGTVCEDDNVVTQLDEWNSDQHWRDNTRNRNCSPLLPAAIPPTSLSLTRSSMSSLQDFCYPQRTTTAIVTASSSPTNTFCPSFPYLPTSSSWTGIRVLSNITHNDCHHQENDHNCMYKKCKSPSQKDINFVCDLARQEYSSSDHAHCGNEIERHQINDSHNDSSTTCFPDNNSNNDNIITDSNVCQRPDVVVGADAAISHKLSISQNNNNCRGKHPSCQLKKRIPIKTMEISTKESNDTFGEPITRV